MKKSTTLVSIVATAILTLASVSANAAPYAKKLQRNTDSSAPENCSWIWYTSGHTIQDKGGIQCTITQKCRRYGLYIKTQTTRIPRHYTERSTTRKRGKAHICSRSNQWWNIQGKRYYKTWRIGRAVC